MNSSKNQNENSLKDCDSRFLWRPQTAYGMIFCVALGTVFVILGMHSSPRPVTAEQLAASETGLEESDKNRISTFEYRPLPVDSNKHSQLARDFMGDTGCKQSYGLLSNEKSPNKKLSGNELTLKAIVWGDNASVVINDCLLEEGQTLTMMTDQPHDIEVIDIRETSVLLRCDEELIELRLTDK